jgi:predicted DNA-binding protein
MPFSLRLDRDTETRIRRLSADTGRSKAGVVREAIAHYAAVRDRGTATTASAYERLKPFIGSVESGAANLSTGTHARYRELLRRKHRRAQRPR